MSVAEVFRMTKGERADNPRRRTLAAVGEREEGILAAVVRRADQRGCRYRACRDQASPDLPRSRTTFRSAEAIQGVGPDVANRSPPAGSQPFLSDGKYLRSNQIWYCILPPCTTFRMFHENLTIFCHFYCYFRVNAIGLRRRLLMPRPGPATRTRPEDYPDDCLNRSRRRSPAGTDPRGC